MCDFFFLFFSMFISVLLVARFSGLATRLTFGIQTPLSVIFQFSLSEKKLGTSKSEHRLSPIEALAVILAPCNQFLVASGPAPRFGWLVVFSHENHFPFDNQVSREELSVDVLDVEAFHKTPPKPKYSFF